MAMLLVSMLCYLIELKVLYSRRSRRLQVVGSIHYKGLWHDDHNLGLIVVNRTIGCLTSIIKVTYISSNAYLLVGT